MQVTLNLNSKQRSSSLNSTRSYKKGLSLTSRSRCQSTQRKSCSHIQSSENTVSSLFLRSQKKQSDNTINNNSSIKNNMRSRYQSINELNNLNPRITFQYTNSSIYQPINETAMIHANRFMNNFVTVEKVVSENIVIAPQSQTIVEGQSQRHQQPYKIKKNNYNINYNSNIHTSQQKHNSLKNSLNPSQQFQLNKNRYLIDSRRIPRTIVNEQVKIFVRQPIIQSIQRKSVINLNNRQQFVGIPKQNKQQKYQKVQKNYDTIDSKINKITQSNNKQFLSPYHMLATTIKRQCQSHKQKQSIKQNKQNKQITQNNETKQNKQIKQNNQIKKYLFQYIPGLFKIQPFEIINQEEYEKTQRLSLQYQQQLKQIQKKQNVNFNVDNNIKNSSNMIVQQNPYLQANLNNEKVKSPVVVKNSQIVKSPVKKSPTRSPVKKQVKLVQNIENMNPCSKSNNNNNNPRRNTKRIRQIQRRLQQIINICDQNM